MAIELGPVGPIAPPPPLAPVSLGSLAVPAPSLPQDQYVAQNAYGNPYGYPPPNPNQFGQDMQDLGDAGGRVLGHVGEGLWNGTQLAADGVAKAAPVVGRAVATGSQAVVDGFNKAAPVVGRAVVTGSQAVVDGFNKAAPVVGRAVWDGTQTVADGFQRNAPAVGHGLWAGIKRIFAGIGNLFSFHKKEWDGPVVVVQPGDTLATIAKRTLGDANRWQEIYQWNADLIPDYRQPLVAGTMLRLPPYIDQQPIYGGQPEPTPTPTPVPTPVPTPAPAPRPAGSYTVKKGDTLSDLARRFYGDEARWPEIYAANKAKIADPHWIYPGQVFTIPRG
ncbi:MAG: hypothetical protein JWM80_4780 [Cyanobacteria bacterium RYN_339]|nr:hypothetical protein [Cyanobacteria bacterium RYN_339]